VKNKPAAAKPIKPSKLWRTPFGSGLHYSRKRFFKTMVPVLVIDLSPASVEALRARLIDAKWRDHWAGDILHTLAALGIKRAR